ncbi:uncharacterized protein CLUP02_04051 [Colletotrichum lupini]|uniref:Uncharacterized protein n=1 Tax=Colletotrichum lupini TaxID=145971 RepID=A0A9Q8SJL8_9PEZI|nr:uncharacterized protein CLUP02_04051 [Colletotrichum lupini]UQC78574.1 hypothetical protein CLUP02_04051 [Colletotrichum lupini]
MGWQDDWVWVAPIKDLGEANGDISLVACFCSPKISVVWICRTLGGTSHRGRGDQFSYQVSWSLPHFVISNPLRYLGLFVKARPTMSFVTTS